MPDTAPVRSAPVRSGPLRSGPLRKDEAGPDTTGDPAGRDLQPFVNLIDEHGPDAILQAVDRLVPEAAAQVTVSTAHKAKVREWARMRIACDFTPPADTEEGNAQGLPIPKPVDEAEARLAYVAVTRARHHLDATGLAWINKHPDNPEMAVS